MNVTLSTYLPDEWKSKKPLQTYETRMLYTGFRRYDTERKVMSEIVYNGNDTVSYKEYPMEDTAVFPRGYTTEFVRVSIYSQSPRVWVEELSPNETFVFIEK